MEALLEGLNEAQRHAVTTPAAVLQVLAPPGSGKTKTLTARVAYLVHHARLKPWNIIVCTFTIKAAREMKERICALIGEKTASKLILGTFHSVARRFLAKYGQEIGIEKNFSIADSGDSLSMIKRIIKHSEYSVDPKKSKDRISNLKSKGITAAEFRATTKKADEHEFACVFSEYEERLKMSNLLDYDDLLLECIRLLRKHPECVNSIEAVLIDEYQDTNNIQYELMTLLAQKMKRITIVGDPDQSIYGWRSAEVENLYKMRNAYPDTLVVNLEENYRSSGCILSSASAVIEQDETRPDKSLQATHCVGEQPTLRHLRDAAVEAEWIVKEIRRTKTLAAGMLDFSDYAILVRSSSLSRAIESELPKHQIPYRMVGGKKFFDRAEIKLVLDYLRIIDQPHHNDALVRIINTPKRGIGSSIPDLLEEAESKGMSLWTLVHKFARAEYTPATEVKAQAEKGMKAFVNIILTSQQKLHSKEDDGSNLFDVITHVLQKAGIQAHLKKDYKDQWEERWANVEELVGQATQMITAAEGSEEDDALPLVDGIEQRASTPADILSKFLASVTLSTELVSPDSEQPQQVTICTMHAAKGLEWPVVFIPAVYAGQFPHSMADDNDEERRLLYVGMTRAQALLYLSCPVKHEKQETTLSPFISSPDIQKLFSPRGPSMGSSTISDLALILRRPCPSSSDVQAARDSVERIEDDEYPVDREMIHTDKPTWGSYDFESAPVPKRRKTDSSSFQSTVEVATTMSRSTGYSVAKTTLPSGNMGFTTARVQQQILEEAKAVGALISAPNASKGKLAYKKVKLDVKETKTGVHKPSKPRAAGQGAITSFFSKPAKTVPPSAAPPIYETPEKADEDPPVYNPQFNRSSSANTGNEALSEISNGQTQPNRQYRPLAFSSHRPSSRPMLTKPKKLEAELESERYVLLSSSPPRTRNKSPVRPLKMSENLEDPHELPSPSKPTAASNSVSSFRPASTFHTTSVAQLQGNSGAQRKTLGTRRSMQGWSVKHSQPPRPR